MSSCSAKSPNDFEISIVIPVFNEEATLSLLYQRVCATMELAKLSFELILVDDGCSDRTLNILRDLARQDHRVRYISFSRNFGHEAASSCGLHHAVGQAVILMDGDLQDPPELIPSMVELWRQGCLTVIARRRLRQGESWSKKKFSYLFYRLLNFFSEVPIPLDVGDFRLLDRRLVEVFKAMPEQNRFLRGMFSWIGFSPAIIEYDREPRQGGETKYNTMKLILLSLDALSGFSLVPLRVATALGMMVVLGSFLASLMVLMHKLFFGLNLPGYALLTIGSFLLGGSQLIFLGVIGEYVGKIYKQVQGRPLYVVQEISQSATPTTDQTEDPS